MANETARSGISLRYAAIDSDYEHRLGTTPDASDGPIWMVNLIRHRHLADYPDGREAGVSGSEAGLSGREADDRYTPFGPLDAVGAEIVFAGEVETQLLGADPPWDRVAVVKYPTRRAFLEMQHLEEFRELHVHKDAGVEATIVMGATPFAPPALPADAPALDAVAHPATDDDPPVVVVHVIGFDHDVGVDASRAEMASYQRHAAQVAVPHGVRIAGWFDVEGTILGDGRQWDQVRFNAFPSRAAFMAVVTDPGRLVAQREHREPAMSDTYTLVVRPVIDRLAASWADESLDVRTTTGAS